MTYARVTIWLRSRVRTFSSARGGNVMLTFALALVPMVGLVGAAIDYSRANSVKAAMQAASNSTALMLSKYVQDLTGTQVNQKASEYFTALFNRTETTGISVAPTFSSPQPGSFKLQLAVTGMVPTTFTKVFGQSELKVNVNSEVLWGIRKLEVALALDNTGSMSSSSKMTNLKIAAHNLLTTLKNAAKKDGDVKVAIIPFDTTVNLGTSYKNNDWFDYDSFDCNGSQSGKGCNSSNWKDTGKAACATAPIRSTRRTIRPPPAIPRRYYPVYDCGSLAKLMPLTYDWAGLNTKIDAMTPNGNTNVAIGLAWAWHALTARPRCRRHPFQFPTSTRSSSCSPTARTRNPGRTPTTPRSPARRRSTPGPNWPAPISRPPTSGSTRSA